MAEARIDAFSRLNALERKAEKHEGPASDIRWEQAEEVAGLLDQGYSERIVADGWLNARIGQPYSRAHVRLTYRAWREFGHLGAQERPRWNDAYHSPKVRDGEPHVTFNSGEEEWYTPTEVVELVRRVLGDIDLDPCSTAEANKLVGARKFFTKEQDGLRQQWRGRVFMNPPYGSSLWEWAEKFAESFTDGDVTQGCVLVNNATETGWFAKLAEVAGALCFTAQRLRYWHPDRDDTATGLQGQAVLYFGENVEVFAREFVTLGTVWLPA
jgi:ParB family chromosome partitioning protein